MTGIQSSSFRKTFWWSLVKYSSCTCERGLSKQTEIHINVTQTQSPRPKRERYGERERERERLIFTQEDYAIPRWAPVAGWWCGASLGGAGSCPGPRASPSLALSACTAAVYRCISSASPAGSNREHSADGRGRLERAGHSGEGAGLRCHISVSAALHVRRHRHYAVCVLCSYCIIPHITPRCLEQ